MSLNSYKQVQIPIYIEKIKFIALFYELKTFTRKILHKYNFILTKFLIFYQFHVSGGLSVAIMPGRGAVIS